jgi:hypothetical protein
VIILPNLFKKIKRTREQNVANDDNENEVEVKSKRGSVFKMDDDEDEVQGSQTPDPVTWGSEPQTAWSQHVEQNHIIVPLSSDPVFVVNMYTPQAVGLYY